jgi:ribonuclease HII
MTQPPTFSYEKEIGAHGYQLIAGIDEVGRGAIAGPVVAAAVILPFQANAPWLSSVRDSKQLSPSKRESLFELIQTIAVAKGVGMVSSEEIDNLGIVEATQLAMCKAIGQLSPPPDFLLIDALALPNVSLPQRSPIHGDRLSLSIACASIVAKVTRDRYMVKLDSSYPGYELARHKGYGTKQHLLNLQQLDPSPIHRQTFAPIKQHK